MVVSRNVSRELQKDMTEWTALSFLPSVFTHWSCCALYGTRSPPIQKNWRHRSQQWDNALLDDSKDKLLKWYSVLPFPGKITFPRAYFSAPVDIVELQIFGDS